MLSGHERDVVRQFVVSGDDGSLSIGVILRTTCSAKDLEDVQNTEVYKCSLLCVVDLGTLSERGRERERGREGGRGRE